MILFVAILPAVAGLALASLRSSHRAQLAALAAIVCALTLGLACVAIVAGGGAVFSWSGALVLTAEPRAVSAVMLVLVPLVSLPVTLYAALQEPTDGLSRLVGLLLVFMGGMELVVMADDLLTLFVGWEIIGATSWALIAHRWRSAETVSSATWAFLVTRTGDLGLLVALMALFSATGSFAFEAIGALSGTALALVGGGIVLSAAAKAAQVPFSPWLFRAMDGPTSVSALLHSATLVAAGAYLALRVEPHLAHVSLFGNALVAFGLVTAVAGGLVALVNNHAKRLLAASTSAHLGLMFVAVGAGFPLVALFHLVAHAALKAPLFLTAGTAHGIRGTYALHRLAIGRAVPALALLSLIPTLSLAGIPPLAGAWTKEKIVAAAHQDAAWIAILAAVAGGLSAAYGFRFYRQVFRRSPEAMPKKMPSGIAVAIDASFGMATITLSLLWIPSLSHAAADLLGGSTVPATDVLWLAISLALVAAGATLGAAVAWLAPQLGVSGWAGLAADWLGLPTLLDRGIARPVAGLARTLAAVDDRILDAVPGAFRAVSAPGPRILASMDDRVVDGGVRLAAGLSRWLARIGDRIGERATDSIPSGTALLIAFSGREGRRLQTGLSYHYYVILVAGFAATVAVLTLGA